MIFSDMPIRRKLMTVMLLTSGAVLLLTWASFIAYEVITLHKNMLLSSVTRAQIIAANSTAALAFQNEADATEVLAALKSDKRMTAACLYDAKGKLFAKYPADAPDGVFPSGPGESGYRGSHLEVFCPVVQGDRKLGTVFMQSDLSALTDRYRAYAWLAVAVIAGSLLLAFFLSSMLQKQISMPILALAETARAISNHRDFSVRAQKFGGDELGLLTDAFNGMLSEILEQNQALKRSEERFRALIENNADGITVSGLQEESLYISPALLRILGFTESEMQEKTRKDLVHPDDLEYSKGIMAETLQNPGKVVRGRYRLKHKDGSWRSVDVTATNFLNNPAIAGIVRNIRDITDQLKMEEIARLGEAQAIESIKDYSIVMLDPAGKILTWNAGAERIKGYLASEIIGQHMSTFYTPEDNRKRHSEELLKIAVKEGRVEDEGWRVRKDGSRFMADVVITALKDEKEKVRGFIKVTRDVTEIKKAQEEIKQANDFLNTILENIPNMIFVKDAKELRFVKFNKAGEELLGLRKSDLLGKNDYDFFPKDQADSFTEKDRKVLEGRRLLDIPEEPIDTKEKGKRLLHTKKIPIFNAQGGLEYLLGISEDITEQKRQEGLRVYAQALEVSNRELQEFVFVVSHDLQEPLRKVQSFGEFLKDEYGSKLEETGLGYLERMRGAAKRMQILINDLLSLTRVTTKAQPFHLVDLSQVVKEVVSDLETRIKEKNAIIEIGLLPVIEADATQMRQLFQNLIVNAIKFQKQGVAPFIKITGSIMEEGGSVGSQCRIQVEDNGIGFENKYGEQIFKVFERLHGQDEYEGTGIGLSICRKVAARHGGTLTAEGFPGKGSVFTLILPVKHNLKGEAS